MNRIDRVLGSIPVYYKNDRTCLLHGDTFSLLKRLPKESIDLIFADPPYFLSNNGITCQAGRMVSVNKGKWDKGLNTEEKHAFNRHWIKECHRILRSNGTIWISGTYHNIYSVGLALEQEGFKILNNIIWEKTNPPPNLACRCFTHSTETILWAKKAGQGIHHLFNYQEMKIANGGKQMKDVWRGALTKKSEKLEGRHPTQKPLYLLERIIEASSLPGYLILDPFCGSYTTGVAAKALNRWYIGIDNSIEYLELSKRRLSK